MADDEAPPAEEAPPQEEEKKEEEEESEESEEEVLGQESVPERLPWHSQTPWWWNPEIMVRVLKAQMQTSGKYRVRITFRIPEQPVFGDDARHPPEDLLQKNYVNQGVEVTNWSRSTKEPEFVAGGGEAENFFFKVPLVGSYNVEEVSSKMAGGLIFQVFSKGFFGDKLVATGLYTLTDAREDSGMDPNKFKPAEVKLYVPVGSGGLCGGGEDAEELGEEVVGTLHIALRWAGWTQGMVCKKNSPVADVPGGNFNAVCVKLPPFSSVKLTPGSLLGLSPSVSIEMSYRIVETGGGGEQTHMRRILVSTKEDAGEIRISQDSIPGQVAGVTLDPDLEDDSHRWMVRQGAWVAHTHAVRIRKIRINRQDDPWMSNLQQAEGKGVLCFTGPGQMITKELAEGEEFMVSGDCLVAWQWRMLFSWKDVTHRLHKAAVPIESVWCAHFVGPGSVVFCTRTSDAFRVGPRYRPMEKPEPPAEAAAEDAAAEEAAAGDAAPEAAP
eukprot:TRINITY_DN2258_c0_g1_i1.p1 TRINITY_DN2258_c0_g1~~TRINITY_DN2258_c0_g1_i1.p1  ORF type:complete len:528 (+),score=193.51 TRINITY_DN2258_c0_g1_i1:95-1585(+)